MYRAPRREGCVGADGHRRVARCAGDERERAPPCLSVGSLCCSAALCRYTLLRLSCVCVRCVGVLWGLPRSREPSPAPRALVTMLMTTPSVYLGKSVRIPTRCMHPSLGMQIDSPRLQRRVQRAVRRFISPPSCSSLEGRRRHVGPVTLARRARIGLVRLAPALAFVRLLRFPLSLTYLIDDALNRLLHPFDHRLDGLC